MTNERRLTKKQSAILLAVGVITAIVFRNVEGTIGAALPAAGELMAVFALISLLSKNGLRWT